MTRLAHSIAKLAHHRARGYLAAISDWAASRTRARAGADAGWRAER